MAESKALELVELLRPLGLEVALKVARAAWRRLPIVEQAAIALDWEGFWLRRKQLPPTGTWRTWGFLTGRGWGKTVVCSRHINREVKAGNARLVCLLAQDEANGVAIQVNGPSGLIATADPDCRPHFEAAKLELVWPNGARAYVRTPEVPGKIRGLEYHLAWMSELQSWPNSTREEAFTNVFLSTRLGSARVLWDATPKRRHPLLKELLAQSAAAPDVHVVVRGTTHENAANLGSGYVAEMQRKYGGTLRGREELLGEMLEDAEGALFKQAWIDGRRRPAPDRYTRKAVGVDPAVSDRKGSDTTGLILAAADGAGHGYVLADRSGKHKPDAWGNIVLDWCVSERVDVVLAETNKGGALVTQNLRALASARKLEVIVVGRDERPTHLPGKVFVKEVYARGAKEDRAEPVAVAYERGRVSHVTGADLTSLEDTLTTWEPAPNQDSPGDLDALVHAMVDLLELNKNEPDARKAFEGFDKVQQKITAPIAAVSLNKALTFNAGRGDRI